MRRIGFVAIALFATLGIGTAAGAVTSSDLDAIARELTSSGRYLEFPSNSDLDRAIDDANDAGIAFVWLDADGDAEDPAAELTERLNGSPYRTVLVLTNTSIGAWSTTVPNPSIQRALDASGDEFADAAADGSPGTVASGIDDFVAGLDGAATTATTAGSSTSETSSGGGIGLGSILLVALLGGGAFLLFRGVRNRNKARKQAEIDLEADRAEIQEQLRDNADHVMELGDRVIAADKPELITTYEQASAAYQEVSGAVDTASTAEEIDRLDDLIDNAEWQFESIEAELEGRPRPPSPAEVEARANAEVDAPDVGGPRPPAPSRTDRPALGPDESVIGGGGAPAPRPQQRTPYPRTRRRSGGLGGVLGGILGSIVLGGGRGGMGGMGGMGSRRTQRRRSQFPGGGSLGGGGVLRRSGSGRSGSSGRRRGSGGSRSTRSSTRRGSGGSRRF